MLTRSEQILLKLYETYVPDNYIMLTSVELLPRGPMPRLYVQLASIVGIGKIYYKTDHSGVYILALGNADDIISELDLIDDVSVSRKSFGVLFHSHQKVLGEY